MLLGENQFEKGKLSPRFHCNLLYHINSCDHIDNIMKTHCIQII